MMDVFILAGGKSSRMGADKGLLDYQGKPLVAHVLEAVSVISGRIHIITGNAEYEKWGYPLVQDILPGLGPAGGVLTSLKHASSDTVLICACDMPELSAGILQRMCARYRKNADVLVAAINGRREPLLAIYQTAILPKWEEMLNQGFRKMTDFLDQLETNIFEVTEDPDYHPAMFKNVNTREDLEK
jgi:molybdopterin-guanine dinucleotide biosynthesis protein A